MKGLRVRRGDEVMIDQEILGSLKGTGGHTRDTLNVPIPDVHCWPRRWSIRGARAPNVILYAIDVV